MPFKYLVVIYKGMITYTITTEQFDKTNKALSEALDMNYHSIDYQTTTFKIKSVGRGGKTMGTTGYKFTEEQRKRMSVSRKGKPNGLLGRKLSEETKLKISESKKGSKWSNETRIKLTESRKNQRHSEETKQKMRESALKREELKRQTVGK
jgi:hypothetical protein